MIIITFRASFNNNIRDVYVMDLDLQMDLWVEKTGTGAMCWPQKFINIGEMFNPFLHFKQQRD
jgi:hypothetical protein